jgi:ketosteroid isomerase-like protein
LRALGDERARALVSGFVDAWDRADVDAIVAMLAEDATFSMPPLPAWFRAREDIRKFAAERVFEHPWRFTEVRMNGQPAMIGHRRDPESGRFLSGALNILISTATASLK